MLNSQSQIKILTPSVHSSNNKYLTCLWSSLNDYEVEIDNFKINHSFSKIKAEKHSGQIIHLHWVKEFCHFDSSSRYRTLRSILAVIRNLIFLKLSDNKIVWTVHNTLRHENNFPVLEYILRWFLSILCNDIIVMSEYSKQELARMYGRKKRVHIVSHGNYIDAYPNQVSIAEARQKLKIPRDKKVILHFGRLQSYKGIRELLNVFQQLKDSNIVLLIAGVCRESSLKEELEQAAKIDFRISLRLQFIENEEIQLYMNACDWVVLPYQKILNSGSVLLALSFGRPVIVPQKGSITELIRDGEQGYCYNDNCSLLSTLNRALTTSSQQWTQMCAQSYALAKEYHWSKIGHQLYQIYSY